MQQLKVHFYGNLKAKFSNHFRCENHFQPQWDSWVIWCVLSLEKQEKKKNKTKQSALCKNAWLPLKRKQ